MEKCSSIVVCLVCLQSWRGVKIGTIPQAHVSKWLHHFSISWIFFSVINSGSMSDVSFSGDATGLYNLLPKVKGQKKLEDLRGRARGNNSLWEGKKKPDIQFSTWFISVKLKLIVCHYWSKSCLPESYQSLLVLI